MCAGQISVVLFVYSGILVLNNNHPLTRYLFKEIMKYLRMECYDNHLDWVIMDRSKVEQET